MTQRYIILMRWTEQGIRNFKDTIKRAEAARSEAEKIGGKFTSYWTFGKYDGIGILEAPTEEAGNAIWTKSRESWKYQDYYIKSVYRGRGCKRY